VESPEMPPPMMTTSGTEPPEWGRPFGLPPAFGPAFFGLPQNAG
jgi:hypothetical protein